MRKSLLGSAAVAVAALALAACSSTPEETQSSNTPTTSETASSGLTEMTPITVGVIPIVDVAPIYLGVEKGFFTDDNLDVTLELAQGGAAIVPAVVSGDYQFGFSNVTSLLLATSKDVPLQVVTAGNFTTGDTSSDFGAVVTKDGSGIMSAKDLAGKTVAVNTLNNIGDNTVRNAVEKDGGDPSSIKFVEMAFPDMPAAVDSGTVDAAWVVEPFVTIATGGGAKVVTYNFAETDPNLMIAAYFTSDDYAAQNPAVVAAFKDAMNQSLDYAQEHPDEVRDILLSYTSLTPELKDAIVLPKFSSELSDSSFTILNDLAVKYGTLSAPVDISALLP
jgi:NitT/TauT family transport system substrate-binding protein